MDIYDINDCLDFPDEAHGAPQVCSPSGDSVGRFKNAVVATNCGFSASVGADILRRGGSAVDAVIGTLLCEGICGMQSMGIGGGACMTIYSRKDCKAYGINAREAAPRKASREMFAHDPRLAMKGGLSIAVPGELMGFWEAWKRFGKMPWKDIFQPAISMCFDGFQVTDKLGRYFNSSNDVISSPTLRALFSKSGTSFPQAGDIITLPELGTTLSIIANSPQGALEFYNGDLTKSLVADIKKAGGIITEDDLAEYRATWVDPVECLLSNGCKLYSLPSPCSGHILSFILKLLDRSLVPVPGYNNGNLFRIAEAFKYGYGIRTEFGDSRYVDLLPVITKIESKEFIRKIQNQINSAKKTSSSEAYYGAKYYQTNDYGTGNVIVAAANGDAVAATSTINYGFGSKIASTSTGVIFNNQMADFSIPDKVLGLKPSPANYIEQGKRPLSSMCPTVVVDHNEDVRMLVGGAGGSLITTAVAQVIMNHLMLGKSLEESVRSPRIHHQLFPMKLYHEKNLPKEAVEQLQIRGHTTECISPKTAITAAVRVPLGWEGMYDPDRRGGGTSGY